MVKYCCLAYNSLGSDGFETEPHQFEDDYAGLMSACQHLSQ